LTRTLSVTLFVLLFTACTATSTLPTATFLPTATTAAPATALPASSATPTPSLTDTSVPAATIPPFLTSIPGISATLTAVASTPGAEETLVAQRTMVAATEGVELQKLNTLLAQCPNPSDPPMKKWVNVPVMPQATGGQVVETLIGNYYCFKAPVTVADMESFYKSQMQPPDWIMMADANGAMQFFGMSQTGMQLLILNSGPGKNNNLIVAINITRPLSVPTP